ncbi:MAG: hypothetical protein L6R42_009576 [Xanthoria sp. 1 TBL-2021]|nr:MAG: hypothetical protein L6R42_009576 [Xanthoria sp. 1 TBL-2021]
MLTPWVLPLLLYIPLLVKAIPAPPVHFLSETSSEDHLQEYADPAPYKPEDYQLLSERGNGYWNKLTYTLQSANPIQRDDRLHFEQFYTATFSHSQPADRDLWDILQKSGIDPDNLDTWATSDKSPKEDWQAVPYLNSFNTRDGLLIAEQNFRDEDIAPQRLVWSELMYHTWNEAAKHAGPKGGPISNLKTVIRAQVVNVQTQGILRMMYENNGLTPRVHFQWTRWSEDGQPGFWDALMGTDNVKGVVFLLNDHCVEMGRKIITEVWTRWDTDFPDIW